MLDKVLIPILIRETGAGFVRAGLTVAVKQGFQPITSGVDTGPSLYLTKLFDHEYGTPRKELVWNAETGVFDRVTTQRIESTFQARGVYKQDPTDLDDPTASDIAQAGLAVLQDDDTLCALRRQGLAVYRITQVRNLQIVNGGGQNEAMPFFDFVIAHNRVTTATTEGAVPVGLKIEGF